MRTYKKGETCYYKSLFDYKPVTIIDIKVINVYYDYDCINRRFEYLIKFKNGRIKSVKEERLF